MRRAVVESRWMRCLHTAAERLAVGAILLLFSAACAGCSDDAAPADAVPLTVEHVYVAGWSAFRRPVRMVVRDPPAFESLWKTGIVWLQTPPPPPPQDFSTTMLIVAAMGEQRTGGYGIRIESVYRRRGQLFVRVQQVSPGWNCLVPQAVTYPADVVRVPRSLEPAAFIEREKSEGC